MIGHLLCVSRETPNTLIIPVTNECVDGSWPTPINVVVQFVLQCLEELVAFACIHAHYAWCHHNNSCGPIAVALDYHPARCSNFPYYVVLVVRWQHQQ